MRNNKNNISFSVRNIPLNHKILTSFYRILTLRFKNITLCLLILTLSFINIINAFTYAPNTSALNYQSSTDIGFTFNPTISVSISPNNLIIPNLTPGIAADSNPITVNVSTNTAYGYHLTANVGSNTDNYNTTNLVHTTSATSTPTTNATFASLAYGANITDKNNLPTNTWGYSYSKDNGTTWQSYSGLPLYSDTEHSAELISTYNPANSKSIDFKIAANSSNTQPSGEYTNIINFYAVSNPEPPTLYDTVRYMTKGTLAENNVKLSDAITQANSGVYTYDPTVYGVASDASNDYLIYFYRGILDTNAGLGTYGSDGQADAWPNYVKLNNGTCWRIVRTTGSGGVKMIYNGMHGATTAGSCANATVNAQTINNVYNNKNDSVVYAGYTYNDKYLVSSETVGVSTDFVLGNNTNLEANNVRSAIKVYIEDIWYSDVMKQYTDELEFNAGYCNDRSIYSNNVMLDKVGNGNFKFGAGYRIGSGSELKTPSLLCVRGAVDLFRYDSTSVNFASNVLRYPVALITADEANFSGNGYDTVLAYNSNSFLCSGSIFWLLSPSNRYTNGNVIGFNIGVDGSLNNGFFVSRSFGVRPVISLMHHIQVTGGTGTATNPWTIE